jgi:hypothetical protein
VTATLHQPIGSSWDASAGPDGTDPRHLSEWVTGSAVHPALAAANLQTLQGPDVLQALLGDRLEALGGHASQYATGAAARLLRPLEAVAAAGGWWCSGLDPLAGWQPMAWGCFKPDAPRIEHREGKGPRARKYEHPTGTPARTFWLQVPAAVAQLVADRFRLPLPAEVAADSTGSRGAFWRWWARTPALPLLLTEGSKKAAALLSAGLPAVALPGIWNGAPKDATGTPQLHPDLAAVPLTGRPCWVVFDHSSSATGRRDVAQASSRLARLLSKAGAASVLVGTPPGPEKGCDDWFAAGRSWEALFRRLLPVASLAVLPRLRRPDRIAPAGRWLGEAAPIPPALVAPLVALAAPMGAGKTEAIAAAVARALADGRPVILIGHRVSLVSALAERLGIPFADDAAPGSDHRLQGLALCIDSLRPGAAVRFRASDWRGALVVVDEAAQVLRHALYSDATAVADHRPEVLEQLQQLLSTAAQVLIADAQLSAPVLEAFEVATGRRALLIGSEHQPAAGRRLISHPSRDSVRRELVAQLQARRRLWIATTALEGPNGSISLAELVAQHWPEARVLRVDSVTISDPSHDASRLAADPNGIAGRHDVVICTPAVAAGLSVTLRDHFAAVVVLAGGTTDPEGVAQAAARVRDGCPRHLYAPELAPGGALRIGCGSFEPQELLRHQSRHGDAIAAQLVGSVDLSTRTLGPWLPLWAELAATTNRQSKAYGATVRGLLEREGYQLLEAAALTPAEASEAAAIGAELQAITATAQAADDAAVMAAELLSDREAQAIERKRRRTPAERAQLARWRIGKAWGLGSTPPTAELLEADRDRLSQRLRFGHTLQSLEARQLQARADQATAARLNHHGKAWAPDLCRQLVGPKLTAADALRLPAWLSRGDWFTEKDPRLVDLQTHATAAAALLRQCLGVSPGKTGTATLRRLLRLTGHRLEAHRCRSGPDRGAYRYRVVAEALPAGVTVEQLQQAWAEQLTAEAMGMDQKIPYIEGER